MKRAVNLLTGTAMLFVAACAGRQVPAPTSGHVAEPVPPVAMPVAEVRTPPSARDIMRHLADSAINAPMWRNARWGVLIVNANSGDTLYAHDADKLFMPASNQKLLTGAVAMQVLGPDYRWRTPVMLRGVQRGNVFRGDVLVMGTGDPSVSDSLRGGNVLSAFDPVVEALTARGIRRITGTVLSVGDAFTGLSTGFGWEIDDLDSPYGAPTDELLFNEGLLALTFRSGSKAGTPVLISRAPTSMYPPIRNDAVTRAATDTGSRIRIAYDSIAEMLHVTGTLAVGDSSRATASYRHPNDAYVAAMRERLTSRGIAIDGAVRAPMGPRGQGTRGRMAPIALGDGSATTTDTLVVLESSPLSAVLPRMQKPSQNQVAEMLFRSAGRVGTGDGSADSARALVSRTLATWGVTSEHLAYRDGSGLSRHDYVSPLAIVRVLDVMHRAPWAALYRAALPLAGVDGTLSNRMRNTPAAGNANAKTGTVDKARALSGYVNTADGQIILFSMLANNFTVSTREVERVQDLLVSTLAGLSIGQGSARVP